MEIYREIINKGDTILEIGAHIGFVTQFFASLTGPNGKVIAFEPGIDNIFYLKKNIENKKNISFESYAISDSFGKANFYEEKITGQTNSLLRDYEGAKAISRTHNEKNKKNVYKVSTISIDEYLIEKQLNIDFIKLDIEGFELMALQGSKKTLKNIKKMVIEITRDSKSIFKILHKNNFYIYDEDKKNITSIPKNFIGNVIAIKKNFNAIST